MRDPTAKTGLAAGALIALMVVASYAGALASPLMFDDANVVGTTLEGWTNGPLHPRWLSYGTVALSTALAGLSVPLLRLENVLLHAATSIALFLLCRALARPRPGAAPAALAAALMFALHPATVYGVGYLAQRSIVMATLFSVLALHAWVCALRAGLVAWFAASVCWFALAALSKEHVVMLPAVIAALTFVLRLEVCAARGRIVGAFVAHAAISLALVLYMRGIIGSVYESYLVDAVAQAPAAADQVYARSALTQAGLFVRYLATWLLPLPALMSIDVRLELVPSVFAPAAVAGAAAFAVYGIVAAWLLLMVGLPSLVGLAMVVPWALYFTEFAAVRGQEPFALYRSYLWAIGLPIGISIVAQLVPRRALAVGTIAVCIALAAGMRDRLATFESPLALWEDAVRKLDHDLLPFADRAIANRGVALLDAGRPTEALLDLDRAIQLNPLNGRALATRGSLYVAAGDLARAEADFDAALRVQPLFPLVYAARCGMRAAQGRTASAREDCEQALRQAPDLPLARLNLGVVYAQRGELARSISEFDRVLAVEPDNAMAQFNRRVIAGRMARAF